MDWDIFLSHSSRDVAAAEEIHRALELRDVRAFLSGLALRPGDLWEPKLKEALSHSPVIAVLASPNTEHAYYQMAEIHFAIELIRANARAHRVVPVLLQGANRDHLPLDLRPLHIVEERDGGMTAVAEKLATLLRTPSDRSPAAALGSATAVGDEIWSHLGPAYSAYEPPKEFALRYAADGAELVRWRHDHEEARITGADLERALTLDQLNHIAVLERSMWVNKIVWNRAYPNRVLNPNEGATADEALNAMGDDLAGVVNVLDEAGLTLDDHYIDIRRIAGQRSRSSA